MAVQKVGKLKSLEDVEKFIKDLQSNLSLQDLNAGDVRTVAPTTDTLGKARYTLVEESGIPVLYYRATDGTLYKKAFDAV